jgi:myxalamid-type nonribosomal peptide synthetase MxaA
MSVQNKCIHQLFESQVERTPNAMAIEFEDSRLTYQELNCRANQLAHYLRSLNIGPDIIVGICMKRSIELIVALLGVLKSGAACLPLDPAYPRERLALMLLDSEVPLLLTQEKLLIELPDHQARVISVDTNWEIISQESDENSICTAKPTNLAYLIYTSGSTGKPKGVMIEHKSLVNFTETAINIYGLSMHDRVLQFASISFDAAVEEIYPCLTCGGTLVLRTNEIVSSLSVSVFLQKCKDLMISVLSLPTAYWHQMVSELATGNLILFESLRLVLIGGEAVLPKRVEMWRKCVGEHPQLINGYGTTETTILATTYTLPSSASISLNHQLQELPIGRAIRNVQTYVLDQDLQPVSVGVPGELHIGGNCLARGYLNRQDLTDKKFISNPYSDQPEDRLYKTGDLVRYLPDGNIEFIGRLDNQVKIRGFRIEPAEIEAALLQHSAILDVIIQAREDIPNDKRLVAYIVLVQGKTFTPSELNSFLKEQLPSYMIPSAIVILEQFPLTPNGKVDRQALLRLDTFQRELKQNIIPPRTPTEEILANIWIDILGLKELSVDDDFFALGGHSLLVAQLIARIRDAFFIELPVSSLFKSPTFYEIAEAIDSILQGKTSAEIDADNINLDSEVFLDSTITPVDLFSNIPVNYFAKPKSIFLTGATGFTGSFLLYELLHITSADIYCLVRASNAEKGKERLQNKLESYGLWDEIFRTRVIPIVGDMSKPLLGLSMQQFHDLANRVDVIYHNGASVNFLYPYSALKATNVFGTEEVLRLACQNKSKPVHFISTLSVFSSSAYSEFNLVQESNPLNYNHDLESGYAQSKWVAEKLVMEARKRGLSVCVYRPGNITGSINNSICNTNDFIWRMVKSCVQLGMAPDIDITVDMTPVDYVAQAIVHLSLQKESFGKAFHLFNPSPIHWTMLVDKIRSFGYPLELVSYDKWSHKLMAQAKHLPENALNPLLPLFYENNPFEKNEPKFGCQNTLDGLAGRNITPYPVNTELLRIYFSYFQNSSFLNPPSLITNQ